MPLQPTLPPRTRPLSSLVITRSMRTGLFYMTLSCFLHNKQLCQCCSTDSSPKPFVSESEYSTSMNRCEWPPTVKESRMRNTSKHHPFTQFDSTDIRSKPFSVHVYIQPQQIRCDEAPAVKKVTGAIRPNITVLQFGSTDNTPKPFSVYSTSTQNNNKKGCDSTTVNLHTTGERTETS